MRRCLDLACKGMGFTTPNPMVGAVLVHEGRIIGEGWHHLYGSDHAEVDCLKSVKTEDLHLIQSSTMYVNLEPCAHYGKTPPCAVRLVQEQVKKVVIGNTDPFEKVSGNGVAILKHAGIEVQTGLLEKEGLWLNRRFFCFHTQTRPYIILKWAQTQDGFIAPVDRSRLQISGPASRQLVHKWRTEEAAIMVGTTTAINDNPQLTARLASGKQPLRIALDRTLKIPAGHYLFDNTAKTWIINELKNSQEGNVRYLKVDFNDQLPEQIMQLLYDAQKLSVIIEGGATLLNKFILEGVWDEARIFTGAISIGEGIKAPKLQHEHHAFTATIESDAMNVYLNKNNPYRYIPGMEL